MCKKLAILLRLKFTAAMCLFCPAFAMAFSGEIKVQAQFWTSECLAKEAAVATCSVPKSLGPAVTDSLTVADAASPGQAIARNKTLSLGTEQSKIAIGQITLISVNPHSALEQPKYIQIQWQSIVPDRVECMQSVRWRDDFEAPPLICASIVRQAGDTFERTGATLTFSHSKATPRQVEP
jgi:hypothetical protein